MSDQPGGVESIRAYLDGLRADGSLAAMYDGDEQTLRRTERAGRMLRNLSSMKATLAPGEVKADSTGMSDETTNLKIALSEAKTDTKFAELMGEMRTEFGKINAHLDGIEKSVGARIDGLDRSVSGIKPTIIVTGLAVAGLMVAVLTYGQTWFGIGVSTRDVVKSAVSEYVAEHQAPAKP